MGRALVRRGIDLVYGGGRVGLMGIVADTVLEGGGGVVGIIPGAMMSKEVAHEGLSELIVVDGMFERKARMMELADGFVALPGGVGTLDEMFEILTWDQLGYLAKPCGLLDVADYYAGLLAFLDRCVDERFLRPEHRAILQVEDDSDALLDALAAWDRAADDKWMDRR
jgi:uncharacterized protein (TIGR00730 family)